MSSFALLHRGGPSKDLLTAPLPVAAVLFLGWAVGSRRAQVEEEGRRRVDAERLRIARELHDVSSSPIDAVPDMRRQLDEALWPRATCHLPFRQEIGESGWGYGARLGRPETPRFVALLGGRLDRGGRKLAAAPSNSRSASQRA